VSNIIEWTDPTVPPDQITELPSPVKVIVATVVVAAQPPELQIFEPVAVPAQPADSTPEIVVERLPQDPVPFIPIASRPPKQDRN
jgi:hypothetical protein